MMVQALSRTVRNLEDLIIQRGLDWR